LHYTIQRRNENGIASNQQTSSVIRRESAGEPEIHAVATICGRECAYAVQDGIRGDQPGGGFKRVKSPALTRRHTSTKVGRRKHAVAAGEVGSDKWS